MRGGATILWSSDDGNDKDEGADDDDEVESTWMGDGGRTSNLLLSHPQSLLSLQQRESRDDDVSVAEPDSKVQGKSGLSKLLWKIRQRWKMS